MPRRALVRIAQVSALAVLAASLGACTPEAEITAPDGLRVELVQQRSDVTLRQAQLRVVNGTDEVITVGTVAVDDPRFAADATRVVAGRSSTVRAGGDVDIRVQLAPAACDAADTAVPRALLEVEIAG